MILRGFSANIRGRNISIVAPFSKLSYVHSLYLGHRAKEKQKLMDIIIFCASSRNNLVIIFRALSPQSYRVALVAHSLVFSQDRQLWCHIDLSIF